MRDEKGGRAGDGLPREISRWLQRFVPRQFPRTLWEEHLRPFVLPAVIELWPNGRPTAESYVWALTRLAAWCLDNGIPLEREDALDPDRVEAFCLTLGKGSRNTARSILRRIGPRLTSRAPWQPPPPRIRRRALAPPYSERELSALKTDAARQSSTARRRAAQAILALGAGAGLDGRWSMGVRGTDVIRAPEAVLVRVGPPSPRTVPVLAQFEEVLLALAAQAEEEPLVGGEARAKNKASRAVARFEAGPGRPTLSASRARSTWLLHHLRAGTRLPELAVAAGLQGVSVLNELLPLVPSMDETPATRMLRGDR